MLNRLKGEITATVGDLKYRLVLDFNAIADFEAAVGLASGMAWFASLGPDRQPSAQETRALIWASMLAHQPNATLRDAGAIMSEDTTVLGRLLQSAMPQEATAEGNAPSP